MMRDLDDLLAFEANQPVELLQTGKYSLWPFLRVFVGSRLVLQKDTRQKPTAAVRSAFFRSGFRGLPLWFKRWDTVVLTSSGQRRLIDGLWTERSDLAAPFSGRTLIIELPVPALHPRSETRSRHQVSHLMFKAVAAVLGRCIRPPLSGTNVLDALDLPALDITPEAIARRFLAERRLYNWLLKRWKPKRCLVVNPYVNMPLVVACHENKVPVIEWQHGAIHRGHYAYRLGFEPDRLFYPDALLAFGEQVADVFGPDNPYVLPERVIPVGSFYLDYLNKSRSDEGAQHTGFRIAVSGQDAHESKIIPFLLQAAQLLPEVEIVYVPRRFNPSTTAAFVVQPNIRVETERDVYEVMRNADLHTTINSTCALESLALGTPNVLMNVENRSRNYFGEQLDAHTFTHYADTPADFAAVVRTFSPPERTAVQASVGDRIATGFQDRLKAAWDSLEELNR